jgi:predicted ATPase
MIRKLQINNYKSLHDLTLDVGRFNVLIGENGCGKSNVLEAIGLVAAAAADKLDNEFLVPRGIRATEPQLMRSAFSKDSLQEPIKIGVDFECVNITVPYTMINNNQPYSEWTRLEGEALKRVTDWWKILTEKDNAAEEVYKKAEKLSNEVDEIKKRVDKLINDGFKKRDVDELKKSMAELEIGANDKLKETVVVMEETRSLKKNILDATAKLFEVNGEDAEYFLEKYEYISHYEDKLQNFIIYSPENTALRDLKKESQIQPLGINGEGLLKLLIVIQSKSLEQRQDIHTSLQLFDWYAQLEIPKDLSQSEDKVTITDRYLTQAFDQRSANEGFLFVLFYIALMVSDDAPKIFAIDNIDTSLNPKLCTKLIKELVRLAKKYDKQVFVTTHNPAILDGIDLGDDEQRLLVLSRNKQGHTRYKRITLEDKPRSSTNDDLKLSEAFLRGYLGGLPKGF